MVFDRPVRSVSSVLFCSIRVFGSNRVLGSIRRLDPIAASDRSPAAASARIHAVGAAEKP
jgi:hypothetical protein